MLREVDAVPELIVAPVARVMFPLVVSVSPEGLPVAVVWRSAEVAELLLAAMVMLPLVVETLAFTKILRPADTANVAPDLVKANALRKITSEFACKVMLPFTATMLAGVMMVVAVGLFAN